LESLGYLEMTPIQEKGLPFVLGNRDFIGQANTGSGKTAVFALGILSKLDISNLCCTPLSRPLFKYCRAIFKF